MRNRNCTGVVPNEARFTSVCSNPLLLPEKDVRPLSVVEASMVKGRDFVLDVQLRYQAVRGGVRVQGGFLPAFEAHLSGERLGFVLVEDDVSYRFEGDVRGDVIEGVVRYGIGPKLSEQRWRAQRAATLPPAASP